MSEYRKAAKVSLACWEETSEEAGDEDFFDNVNLTPGAIGLFGDTSAELLMRIFFTALDTLAYANVHSRGVDKEDTEREVEKEGEKIADEFFAIFEETD